MLDLKFIRENLEVIKKSVSDRQMGKAVDIDTLLTLDTQHRDLLRKVEEHRALKNQLSADISKVDAKKREKLITEATAVKEELLTLEAELAKVAEELQARLLLVPNLISDDVPYGKSEDDNQVLKSWGEPTVFDFTPKDHIELGTELELFDFDTSAAVSGARFVYIKNEAALLQFALIQWVLGVLTNQKIIAKIAKEVGNESSKPFVPVVPPVIYKEEVAKKMDRFDPVEERYYFEKDKQLLVGSAEHTLGPMFMDYVIDDHFLPLRYIGYSTAFRREAGSYGKDTKGILRLHHFDKLEMESFSLPENGRAEQNLIVGIQEYLVQQLAIPYQLIAICTGDMGKPDYRQVDVNCWMPGQNTYRETHTSDYMTDFQARRLNTKYKRKMAGAKEETGFVHMNDATAFAVGRILIAILENYQQKDGSIKVPPVLVPFMHGITKITKKSERS